jgi:lysophospholipase L1-like esterase
MSPTKIGTKPKPPHWTILAVLLSLGACSASSSDTGMLGGSGAANFGGGGNVAGRLSGGAGGDITPEPGDTGAPTEEAGGAVVSADAAADQLSTTGRDASSEASSIPAWTGTWSASPQDTGTTFQQKTLRQIVHTSIGGTAARVELSNAFGQQPLTLADVHIAARASGSSIMSGTDRAVSFGGMGSVTIAPGALATSDPIAFDVIPLSDVAVSVYIAQSSAPATFHGQGTQTNYIASGDVSKDTSLSGVQTMGSYYFLANVDVQSPGALGAVVTLGASITDGVASSNDANHRWPNYLAIRLVNAGIDVGVLNQGISGNQLLVDGSGQSALNRFDRDVLEQPGVRWVIFSDDPINDLGNSKPPPDKLITAMGQLITRAHQKGIKFFCSTLTPFEGAGYWTMAGEIGREAVNAFIRGASSGCDAIIDQDTATHDPAHPTRYLPAYDAGDHLHPNDAGMQAIANAVDLTVFTR